MRAPVLLRLVLVTTPWVAACAAVLGIEKLPLATQDGGAADDAGVPPEVPDACDSPDASFCARSCPAYDFCDDFEAEGPDFYRWHSPSLIPKPFLTNAFGAHLDLVSTSADRGTTLVVEAESHNAASSAIGLLSVLPESHTPAPPRGIATRMKGQLQGFSFPDQPGLTRKAGLFGVAMAGLPIPVAMLTIYENGPTELDLAVEERQIGGSDTAFDVVRAKGVPRIALEAAFPEVELVVGLRSVLIRNKYPCNLEPDEAGADDAGGADAESDAAADEAGIDSGVAADPVVVYVRSVGLSKCGALTGDLADPSWLTRPGVFAGASIGDNGRVKWAFDDVAARYLY